MHHYEYELELAKAIRTKSPESKIIFSGPFSETKPELFSESSDYIVKGELETWCNNLISYNNKNENFENFSDFPIPSWDIMK